MNQKHILLTILFASLALKLHAGDDIRTLYAPQSLHADTVETARDSLMNLVSGGGSGIYFWEYLADNSTDEAVRNFYNAFKIYLPAAKYRLSELQEWQSPLEVLYLRGKTDLAIELANSDPSVINLSGYGYNYTGPDLLTLTVQADDVSTASKLLQLGANVNTSHLGRNESLLPINLLTLSTSTEMDRLLIASGIMVEAPMPLKLYGTINDNEVNLRNGPGIEYSTKRKLRKSDRVNIESATYKTIKINGYSGRWIFVKTTTDEGWCFSKYLDYSATQ